MQIKFPGKAVLRSRLLPPALHFAAAVARQEMSASTRPRCDRDDRLLPLSRSGSPSHMEKRNSDVARAPKVSFVSLGCPKALVDSERIITRLRAEGYELTRGARGRRRGGRQHLRLSRQRPGRVAGRYRQGASRENGKVIVTGCMGAEPEKIIAALPERARGHRPAAIRERGRGRPSRGAAAARSVPRSAAAGGHQAHAAALRLSEDFRGLQQSLQLLHHPEAAGRPRFAARRRRAARSRAPGRPRA